MADPRRAILERIAAATGRDTGRPASPPAQAVVITPATGEPDALLARFGRSLDGLGVSWEVAESAVAARLKLVAQLQDEGVKQLLSWSDDQLPVPGIVDALTVLGVQVLSPQLPPGSDRLRVQDREGRVRFLSGIDAVETGLTGAEAAVATTGTLVLRSGPGRSPLVSQLPRRHLLLLPAGRIFPTLEAWLAELRRRNDPLLSQADNVTLMTGPGRTLDIELTAALGAHGPRQLHVIVVRGG